MIQRSIARLTLACGLLASAFAANLAHADACPSHYVDGRKPEITNPKLEVATKELCYNVFGVMHSGITRTPVRRRAHPRTPGVCRFVVKAGVR